MTDERPPFLGTWNRVYALVIGTLLGLILFFYLFTRYFQ